MLDALLQLFRGRVALRADAPPPAREHALRLAAAALLFEIVRADASVEQAERTVTYVEYLYLHGLIGITNSAELEQGKPARYRRFREVSL